jgi:hypothetical protein
MVTSAAAQEDIETDDTRRHRWSRIEYPSIRCPWATQFATPSLHVSDKDALQGLQFRLTFYSPGFASEDAEEWVSPEPSETTTRLHLRSGEIIQPQRNDDPGSFFDDIILFFGGARGAKGHLTRTFPWAENSLDEAWLELRMPGYTYWIEIPYGFVRDPSAPLCGPSDAGRPQFAGAMRELGADDKIVNWSFVEYELGRLQNGLRRLTLNQLNSIDASSDIVLGTADFSRWDPDVPRAGIELREEKGDVHGGRSMSLRSHDHGWLRSDRFQFSRNPEFNNQRDWGTMSVNVDEETFDVVLPSSVFRYRHGIVDPDHADTIRD